MRNIKLALLCLLGLLAIGWALAEDRLLTAADFFAHRAILMQLSGIIAIGCMSAALLLALRPRWPERWFGGLDKMYRLHKWLGISALVVAVMHWLLAKGPKWASQLGLLQPRSRPARVPITDPVQAFLNEWRGTAESVGEWAFYGAALLLVLALVPLFPYRLFYKTHRLLALAFLALVFHAAVLLNFPYWTRPIGWLVGLLLIGGCFASILLLLRRVGSDRQVWGRIVDLKHFAGVRTLEVRIALANGWPGHKAGQFAFAMSDPAEGPHPYTIASCWKPGDGQLTIIAKELGDHTRRLRDKLKVGQAVRVEGPYGCFTFDDGRLHQIWVAGGIGITPFIARLEEMAAATGPGDWPEGQLIDLIHTTTEVDEEALGRLSASARAANVRLHLLIGARDGRLTGERLRELVPGWEKASVWFCGPAAFSAALKQDLAAHGFPVDKRFHQELFAMR